MGQHAEGFDFGITRFPRSEELDAGESQTQALEEEHRVEEVSLVSGDDAVHTPLGLRLLAREREARYCRMGVHFEIVWEAVVLVMSLAPPAAAHADQIAGQEEDDIVLARPREDLAMPGVVYEVADLGEDEGEVGGVQEPEPEGIEQEHACDAEGQQGADDKGLGGVEAGLTVVEPLLLDETFQEGVIALL